MQIVSIFIVTYIIDTNTTLQFLLSLITELSWWALVWVLKWEMNTNFKKTKQKLIRMMIVLIFMTVTRLIMVEEVHWIYWLIEFVALAGLSFWGGKGCYFGHKCGRYIEQVSYDSRYEMPNLKLRLKSGV